MLPVLEFSLLLSPPRPRPPQLKRARPETPATAWEIPLDILATIPPMFDMLLATDDLKLDMLEAKLAA